MLKLTDSPDISCTRLGAGNGINMLVLRSADGNASDVKLRSEKEDVCLLFNYGDPISVKQGEEAFDLEHGHCNTLTLVADQLELYLKGRGSWLVYLITLQPRVFRTLMDHFHMMLQGKDTGKKQTTRLFRRNLLIGDEISHNLYRIETESAQPGSMGARIYGRLLIILSLKYAQYRTRFIPAGGKEQPSGNEELARVHMVEQIIRTDFTTPYTLRELAKLSGTNECYLKRDFKAAFGLPVYAYQRKVKMELANDLLLNTTKSILGISKQLGYKYITHFIAAYKRYYRVTPGKVRDRSGHHSD